KKIVPVPLTAPVQMSARDGPPQTKAARLERRAVALPIGPRAGDGQLLGVLACGAGRAGRALRTSLRLGAAISPSRMAALRAALRVRRTDSAASRTRFSEGFS